jgi:voltage-gated potassium channel
MEEITRSLIFAVSLILILHLVGVIAYAYLEGWNWVDSVYFVSSTITTVGYGEIVPTTVESKLFTTIFMWAGISVGFYLIFMIARYRESKLDTRLFSFLSRFSKKPGPIIPEKPGHRMHNESEIRAMVNPVRPIRPDSPAQDAKKQKPRSRKSPKKKAPKNSRK